MQVLLEAKLKVKQTCADIVATWQWSKQHIQRYYWRIVFRGMQQFNRLSGYFRSIALRDRLLLFGLSLVGGIAFGVVRVAFIK